MMQVFKQSFIRRAQWKREFDVKDKDAYHWRYEHENPTKNKHVYRDL